ncbi:MAG: M28 family peptidase [Anaerolineae bacterium]|nr:M28 family peptidase [Anaerolineae bacterium]
MPEHHTLVELDAARLMDDVRQLSVEIGPRPATSPAEHEAADYLHAQLCSVNPHWELLTQTFRSLDGFRYRIAPLAFLAGLSLLVGLRRDRETQITSGLFSIALSILSRDAFLARPAVWEEWLPRGASQNVIVRIPPRRRIDRRIVFVAHMDSGVHRLTTTPGVARHLPRTLGGITLMALVGGVLTALSGRNQRWREIRALIAASALAGSGLAMVDEMGAKVAGAIGNASGVAALMGLARTLHARPANSTEVILAFTGSATAVSTGADVLATEYGKAWKDALWVVVNNVGAGELCWVTRHGISPYAYYYPDDEAVNVLAQVAQTRPDLGMMGKQMLTVDEVAILRDRDLRAAALMAYDRVTGLLPHWRQISDTVHEVEPATLERAAHACWTAVQLVDQADSWPSA